MQRSSGTAYAWTRVIVGLTLVLLVAAFALSTLGGWSVVLATMVVTLIAAPSVVLGLVVARKRPANPVGPLLALNGLVVADVALGDGYRMVLEQRPDALPVIGLLGALTYGTWMLLYVPFALLMLVFPDGRFLSRRWRWVAVAMLTVVVLFWIGAAMSPDAYEPPFDEVERVLPTLPAWTEAIAVVLLLTFLGLLFACAWSMVLRHRRARTAVERAQVRWFALAGLLLPATLLLCWLSYLLLGTVDLVVIGLVAMFVAIPAAAAIAILRHDLYDVNTLLARTLTYAVLTAVLLVLFTGVSVVGGRLLGGDSALVAAAATAVCAVALAPVRSRVQSVVDRKVYPLRSAALDALDGLRARTITDEDRPESVQHVLRTALHDPDLRVTVLGPDGERLTDVDGRPVEQASTPGVAWAPIVLGQREIGRLSSPKHPAELLREVAKASGLLVEVIRLRAEVGHALDQAEQSRTRLLHAGYEERRKLERDLHDGAQQRLVSLGMSLRLAQRHLDDDTVDVDELLDQSVAEIGTAVAELRTIAHGLRPSSLDDGLGPALVAMTRRLPLIVALDVGPGTESLAGDTATTAYYVATEAVTNSVKYAGAERIDLKVARQNGHLQVRVSDDGSGGATVRPGCGLADLADRVAAAGGRMSVTSPRGRGTVVEAVLPCGS